MRCEFFPKPAGKRRRFAVNWWLSDFVFTWKLTGIYGAKETGRIEGLV